MSHAIFGDRFAAVREPAWHHLGTVYDQPIPPSAAMVERDMDFGYEKRPLLYAAPDGSPLAVPGQVALVRVAHGDLPEQLLSIVGTDYGILSERVITEILDPVAQTFPLETIGSLDEGRSFFVTLDAGRSSVGGEEVRNFFLFTDGKGNGQAARFAFTPVRVVCQNTLVAGLKAASVSATIMHHKHAAADVRFTADVLSQLATAQNATISAFQAMADCPITDAQAQAIFDRAYPHPSQPRKSQLATQLAEVARGSGSSLVSPEALALLERRTVLWQQACGRQDSYKQLAGEAYSVLNDEHPAVSGTAWAAYNAVVECADFRPGRDSRYERALLGERADEKVAAFRAAYDLVRA